MNQTACSSGWSVLWYSHCHLLVLPSLEGDRPLLSVLHGEFFLCRKKELLIVTDGEQHAQPRDSKVSSDQASETRPSLSMQAAGQVRYELQDSDTPSEALLHCYIPKDVPGR